MVGHHENILQTEQCVDIQISMKPLCLRIYPAYQANLLENLVNLSAKDTSDTSVPLTAIRAVISSLPRPAKGAPIVKTIEEAYTAVSKVLIPRLAGTAQGTNSKGRPTAAQKSMLDAANGADIYAIDVLNEVVRCFGPILTLNEIDALQTAAMNVLDDDKTSMVVKKRAVVALSALGAYFNNEELSNFVNKLVLRFRNPHLTADSRRLLISIVGSLAKSIPKTFGPNLHTLGAFLFSPLGDVEPAEDDVSGDTNGIQANEVREAALVAIENCQLYCGEQMRYFTTEIIDVGTRLLKYDPFYADDSGSDDGEDDEMGLDGDDDEFDDEGDFGDDDDNSWKVRRSSAKLLYSLITTRASGDLLEDGTLYKDVAPALIDRFSEREENVRIEVVTALSALIKKTDPIPNQVKELAVFEESQSTFLSALPTRKRRRELSDVSFAENLPTAHAISPSAVPTTSATESLSKLTPKIIKSAVKLLKDKSPTTQQAAVILLKDLVVALHGGLADYLGQIIEPLTKAMGSNGSNGSTGGADLYAPIKTTDSNLRIESLRLLSKIAELHSSTVIQPYLSTLIPAVVNAIQDRYYKTSSEALLTVEQLVRVITSQKNNQDEAERQKAISTLHESAQKNAQSNDSDLEVRERAIHVLGLTLSLTTNRFSSKLFTTEARYETLNVLLGRLKNETTRIATARAIALPARTATKKEDYPPDWVKQTTLELGANLRKSNRSLRGASLSALVALAENPASRAWLDIKTKSELVNLLIPLMSIEDLHLLAPSLSILSSLFDGDAKQLMTTQVSDSVCTLVRQPLSGYVLDNLLALVKVVGEQGAGAELMEQLLKNVGVAGDISVVGTVTGRLLAYGQSSVGIKIDDFVNELQSTQDNSRRCLALTILGETGLCLGPSFPLKPDIFLEYFGSNSDQVSVTAATALGRAGSSNIPVYLPVILGSTEKEGSQQYLLLSAVKELLQNANDTDLAKHSNSIWKKVLLTVQAEENKGMAAECIGKLLTLDPTTYLPKLEVSLSRI
jgi:cullin-associated NEDD8-dissociated protein 1